MCALCLRIHAQHHDEHHYGKQQHQQQSAHSATGHIFQMIIIPYDDENRSSACHRERECVCACVHMCNSNRDRVRERARRTPTERRCVERGGALLSCCDQFPFKPDRPDARIHAPHSHTRRLMMRTCNRRRGLYSHYGDELWPGNNLIKCIICGNRDTHKNINY